MITSLNNFILKTKRRISEYFVSTAWPWEIISGLFIVLIMINSSEYIIDSQSLDRTGVVVLIVTINFLWAVVDGLLLIFTNLLEKGRYYKLASTIKSSDKSTASQILSSELNRTLVTVLDEKTRESIKEIILSNILLMSTSTMKRHKISSRDLLGLVIVTFFVFLPSILILPFFLYIGNIAVAILVSNLIGSLLLFGFGYRLGDCINRNKILMGLTVAIIGLLIMFLGTIIGA